MVRLACSTLTFNDRPLDQALRAIRDLGFVHADLAVFAEPGFGHLTPAGVADGLQAAADAVTEGADAAGVSVVALNAGCGEVTFEEEYRLVMGLALLAHRVGAPVLTLPAGQGTPAEAARRLTPFVEVGRRYGVTVTVEVHAGNLTEDADAALALVGQAGGLKLTLDPSHVLIRGGRLEDWLMLLPHVAHVHLRDAAAGGWRNVQVGWGAGELDLPAWLEALDRAGYSGSLSVEYLRLANLPEAPAHDPVGSIAACKAALEGVLAAG